MDKNIHEQLAVILSIFTFNLQSSWQTSPEYAEKFMVYAYDSKKFSDYEFQKLKVKYEYFVEFLDYLYDEKGIRYPLSKELYGVDAKNYKVQIPILMIVAAFFDELYSNYHYRNSISFDDMYIVLQNLKNSYLEDKFKGSSTRPKQLENTLNSLIEKYKELKYNS